MSLRMIFLYERLACLSQYPDTPYSLQYSKERRDIVTVVREVHILPTLKDYSLNRWEQAAIKRLFWCVYTGSQAPMFDTVEKLSVIRI